MSVNRSNEPEAAKVARPSDRLVSIVIPTYNRSRFIEKALASIQRQTYSPIEVVVVNDGSTDDTPTILERWAAANPGIRCVSIPNAGIANAINTGFRHALGEYVTWNSDDNYYHPDAIGLMVRHLDDHPEVDFVYTDVWDVNAEGERLTRYVAGPPERLLYHCNIRGCLLYRAAVNTVVGPYDARWRYVQDYNFYRRAYDRVRMAYIPEAPYDYTVHEQSMTGSYKAILFEYARHQHRFLRRPAERLEMWGRCMASAALWEASRHRPVASAKYAIAAAVLWPPYARRSMAAAGTTSYQAVPDGVRRAIRRVRAVGRGGRS